MTIGLQLLRAVCDHGAQTTFRASPLVWFTEQEQEAHRFVARHLSIHGRLPSHATLRENGVNLPVAEEPPAYYEDRVRRRSILEQMRVLHPGFLGAVKDRDADSALDVLRSMIRNADAVNPSASVVSVKEVAQRVLASYHEAKNTHRLLGVTIGWEPVDELTDGAQPGDVVVLVGRPGLGKSQMLTHMMRQAWLAGKSVFLISMEMSDEQIIRRFLGLQAGVDPGLIRKGRLSMFGESKLFSTVAGLDDMPPFHVMSGNFSKSVGDVDRAMADLGVDAGYIDAGYLLAPEKRGSRSSRRELIADVIGEIKGVAINRKRPMFTTVQFNRQVKKRQRGDLELSDIGETDVIPQIGSVVIGARYADPPYDVLRRRLELMKNRDGGLVKWEINYGFTPPDLSYIRTLNDSQEAQEETNVASVAHML